MTVYPVAVTGTTKKDYTPRLIEDLQRLGHAIPETLLTAAQIAQTPFGKQAANRPDHRYPVVPVEPRTKGKAYISYRIYSASMQGPTVAQTADDYLLLATIFAQADCMYIGEADGAPPVHALDFDTSKPHLMAWAIQSMLLPCAGIEVVPGTVIPTGVLTLDIDPQVALDYKGPTLLTSRGRCQILVHPPLDSEGVYEPVKKKDGRLGPREAYYTGLSPAQKDSNKAPLASAAQGGEYRTKLDYKGDGCLLRLPGNRHKDGITIYGSRHWDQPIPTLLVNPEELYGEKAPKSLPSENASCSSVLFTSAEWRWLDLSRIPEDDEWHKVGCRKHEGCKKDRNGGSVCRTSDGYTLYHCFRAARTWSDRPIVKMAKPEEGEEEYSPSEYHGMSAFITSHRRYTAMQNAEIAETVYHEQLDREEQATHLEALLDLPKSALASEALVTSYTRVDSARGGCPSAWSVFDKGIIKSAPCNTYKCTVCGGNLLHATRASISTLLDLDHREQPLQCTVIRMETGQEYLNFLSRARRWSAKDPKNRHYPVYATSPTSVIIVALYPVGTPCISLTSGQTYTGRDDIATAVDEVVCGIDLNLWASQEGTTTILCGDRRYQNRVATLRDRVMGIRMEDEPVRREEPVRLITGEIVPVNKDDTASDYPTHIPFCLRGSPFRVIPWLMAAGYECDLVYVTEQPEMAIPNPRKVLQLTHNASVDEYDDLIMTWVADNKVSLPRTKKALDLPSSGEITFGYGDIYDTASQTYEDSHQTLATPPATPATPAATAIVFDPPPLPVSTSTKWVVPPTRAARRAGSRGTAISSREEWTKLMATRFTCTLQ